MKAIDSRTAATATNGTADICFPRYIELADIYGMHISILDALKKDFGRIFLFCLCRRTGKRTDGRTNFFSWQMLLLFSSTFPNSKQIFCQWRKGAIILLSILLMSQLFPFSLKQSRWSSDHEQKSRMFSFVIPYMCVTGDFLIDFWIYFQKTP